MSLSVGIVGLPNVGKSCLFKALTKKQVNIANYPFCTVDPNVGVVKVPDERLEKLAKILDSTKIIPTIIEFVDIAGLVKGAYKGEGLGNQFLAHIREADAIVHLVRVFEDKEISHVEKTTDPKRDIETVNLELIMKDLEALNKRITKVSGEAKTGNKEKIKEMTNLNKIKAWLEKGLLLNQLTFDEYDTEIIKTLALLTAKPMLIVFNDKIESKKKSTELEKILRDLKLNLSFVQIDAKFEADLGELSDEEKESYRKELGISQDGVDQIIKNCYKLLNLVTFFTIKSNQIQAWTIKKNTRAVQAAGVIHSDFEKGFIRAEVIDWQKLLQIGSFAKAREKGLIRSEGKDYIVKDGEVIEFKI